MDRLESLDCPISRKQDDADIRLIDVAMNKEKTEETGTNTIIKIFG